MPEPPVSTPTPPRPGPNFGPPGVGPGFAPTPGPSFDNRPMNNSTLKPASNPFAPKDNKRSDLSRPVDNGSVDQLVIDLRNVAAADVATAVRDHFQKRGLTVTVAIIPDVNRIVVSGNAEAVADAKKIIGDIDAEPLVRTKLTANRPTPTPSLIPPAANANDKGDNLYQVILLKHADAADIGVVLQQVFGKEGPQIVAETRSNSLIIVRADPKTTDALKALIEKLDVPAAKGLPMPKR
jgi:type II secretory pathway component GspD/PulD (secretin)